jgi:hypothetical protein
MTNAMTNGFRAGTGSSFSAGSSNRFPGSINRFPGGFHRPGFAGNGFRPFGGGFHFGEHFGNGFILRRPFLPGFGFGCCGGFGFGGFGFGFGWPGYWPSFYDPFWYDSLWGWPSYGYSPGYYGGNPGVYYDPNAYYDPNYDLRNYSPNANNPDNGAPDNAVPNTGAPPTASQPSTNGDTSLNAPGANRANVGGNAGASAGQMVTLYFKDGTQFAASDYWFANEKLHYVGSDGSEKTIDLADLDLQRTIDENAKVGVKFWLKSSPNGSKAAPAAPDEHASDEQKTPANDGAPVRAT